MFEKASDRTNTSASAAAQVGERAKSLPAVQPAQLAAEEEEAIQGKFTAAQLAAEEEEPLQGKFETVQKVEEEEPVQGKFDTAQLAAEEEEPLQGKFETLQKVEEEEPMQGKFNTAQLAAEEEEPLQGKFETVQKVEEEEPMQGKFETAQLAAEEEEPLQGKFETVQKVEEEEPMQGKFETAQLAAEEEEPLQGKFAPIQKAEEEEPLQGKFTTIQKKGISAPFQLKKKLNSQLVVQRQQAAFTPNNTGLPNQLKSGIETLSGFSMNDVKVHYNSSKPKQLKAYAYAQGTDIHVAPGQEKHLAHEAWHVAQQKQGRVQPTVQMKQGTPVNDDAGLEHEADVMGARALEIGGKTGSAPGGARAQLKKKR